MIVAVLLSGCKQEQVNEAVKAKIQCMKEQGILFVKVKSGGEAGIVICTGIDAYGNTVMLGDDVYDSVRIGAASGWEIDQRLLERMNEQLTEQAAQEQVISDTLLKQLSDLEEKELEPLNVDISGADGFTYCYYLIRDVEGEKQWIQIYRDDSFKNEWGHPDDKKQNIKEEVCKIFAEE